MLADGLDGGGEQKPARDLHRRGAHRIVTHRRGLAWRRARRGHLLDCTVVGEHQEGATFAGYFTANCCVIPCITCGLPSFASGTKQMKA
jgi:hypothetical protein